MIWIIISAVVFFVALWIGTFSKKKEDRDVFSSVMIWGLVSFMIIAAGNRIFTSKLEENFVQELPIIALANSAQIDGSLSGSFLLFSGNLGQEEVYKFFVKNHDGSLEMMVLPARGTHVYEDGKDNPRMTVKKYKLTENYHRRPWMSILPVIETVEDLGTELHIPPNSIARNINISLNKQ